MNDELLDAIARCLALAEDLQAVGITARQTITINGRTSDGPVSITITIDTEALSA